MGSQRARRAVLGGLLLLGLAAAPVPAASAPARAQGCRPELGGQVGARLAAQRLAPDASGEPAPEGGPTTELEARSGQVLRLLVRPVEGPARPAGPDCPVRVDVGRLTPVARPLAPGGFVLDRGSAYGLLRPGEERALDFEVKPFAEWGAAVERVEVENLTLRLPETAEFAARLPEPARPPPGTVCADVVYPDAEPAAGAVLALAAPPGGVPDRRAAGPDGRACWDGFDEPRYGDLSLEEPAEPALGLPKSRYVSHEAGYRLFVVRRPR
jgi:hypothetical protein